MDAVDAIRLSRLRRGLGSRSTVFFFQAEDGIRDADVTGVQTCALPIYRYAVERAMRALGGWIALTPELSAKLLMGRHVWDLAQQADAFGRRLPELRAHTQVSEPASERVVAFMDAVEEPAAPGQTVERLVGVYRVLKPHLLATYHDHLVRANPVYEPPTRRLLLRCIDDERRHSAAGETVLGHLCAPALAERVLAWQRRLEALVEAAGGV